jgi:hypothetical protein
LTLARPRPNRKEVTTYEGTRKASTFSRGSSRRRLRYHK